MTDHHETVRSPEQIAFDLAKAMQFSLPDLRSARKGILPLSSFQPLFKKVLRPLVKAAGFTLIPLMTAAYLASPSHKISEGLVIVFSILGNIKEFAADHGWLRTILYIMGILVSVGFGVYNATKIPLDIVGDMLAKRVRAAEGRVTVREEDKKGKRDTVTIYYFQMKERSFQVSRKAYLALDDGGSYRVYYLPRSQTLVAIEPTVLAKEAEEKEQRIQSEQEAPSTI